jgi:hypothetical protein
MSKSKRRKRKLSDVYRFAGFRPDPVVRGVFGDPKARVVTLIRRSKKQSAAFVGVRSRAGTTIEYGKFAIYPPATSGYTWRSRSGGCSVSVAAW